MRINFTLCSNWLMRRKYSSQIYLIKNLSNWLLRKSGLVVLRRKHWCSHYSCIVIWSDCILRSFQQSRQNIIKMIATVCNFPMSLGISMIVNAIKLVWHSPLTITVLNKHRTQRHPRHFSHFFYRINQTLISRVIPSLSHTRKNDRSIFLLLLPSGQQLFIVTQQSCCLRPTLDQVASCTDRFIHQNIPSMFYRK